MTQDTNLQAQSISAGLQKLEQLLESPVAINALELGRNAAAAREYDVLKRLHKSLLQYLQRNGNLFYAGVLGHFSAGKSSTINSLLGTWNTKNERTTDLHPTDTPITLITQEKNGPSLLGVIREGHVTIRFEPVESKLLEEIVLVDTPGTGDPQFIEEVARDFLPICDLILFLFSAASPLDKSDVPLLTELHKRLPFIPIHFVVTRTDELRSDPNVPLAEENLDPKRTEQFLNGVVARVNNLLSPQVYVPSNFSLIDNKRQFRVQKLKEFLISRCNSSNPQAHVSMHLNKLHFYRSGSKSLRNFFSDILDKKLEELTKIVEAARKNIDRYQQLVQISNSNLTKTWMEHAGAIKAAANKTLEVVPPLDTLPRQYGWFRLVMEKRNRLNAELSRSAKYDADSIASTLKAQVNGILQEHLYRVQKRMDDTPLNELAADIHANVGTPRIAVTNLTQMREPISLYNQSTELREEEADALRSAAGQLRRSLSALNEQVSKSAPFSSAAQSIDAANESLKGDLSQFFQNVELYRAGVFSHTTKESISTLGIGAKLDALETEFTDTDREKFTLSANSDLFPGAHELLELASKQVLDLGNKTLDVSDKARDIRIERPEDNSETVQGNVASEGDALRLDIQAGLQSEADRFCSRVSVSIASLVVKAKTEADSELKLLGRARVKRYSIALAVTAVLYILASLAYHHSGMPAPNTLAGVIALEVGCGLLVEALVFIIMKTKENVPILLAQTRKKAHVVMQEDIKDTIETDLKELKLNSINEQALTTKLTGIYERALDLPSPAWDSRAKETLESIRELSVEYGKLRASYVSIVEKVREDASQYFADSSRNLSILTGIAARIKEKAIEPSFDLLEATRKELLSIKTEVEAIEFD